MDGGDRDAAMHRRLADLAPFITFIVDEVGTITWSSGAVDRLFGRAADEVVGTNILDHIDAGWSPEALDSVGYAMTASGLQRPMLFRLNRPDGQQVVIEVTANAQHDDPLVGGLAVYARPWHERWLLDQVLDAIAGTEPIDHTLDLLVQVMGAEILEADGVVLRRDPDTDELRSRAASGLGPGQRGLTNVPEAPWAEAMRSGRPVEVPVAELPAPLADEAFERGHRWCWAWPVVERDGASASASACLVLWRRADEVTDHTCRLSLDRLVRLTSLVLDRERTAGALRHAAHHDALTGLANRARFFEALQDTLDDPTGGPLVGVLYIDLDGFKPVNDQLGHGIGDAVLKTVALRLRAAVRDSDLVARIGGDEFTVLCPDIEEPAVLERLAERLVATVREPITVGDERVSVGASLGIAATPPLTCSIDVLLDAADRALYRVKGTDKGTWAFAPAEDLS